MISELAVVPRLPHRTTPPVYPHSGAGGGIAAFADYACLSAATAVRYALRGGHRETISGQCHPMVIRKPIMISAPPTARFHMPMAGIGYLPVR